MMMGSDNLEQTFENLLFYFIFMAVMVVVFAVADCIILIFTFCYYYEDNGIFFWFSSI